MNRAHGRSGFRAGAVAALTAGGALLARASTLFSEFDDVGLQAGAYWNGSDLSGGFRSGWAFFRNAYDADWDSWSGFACSAVSDTNTPGYFNQYAVWMPGTGRQGSSTYAVAYDSAWDEQDVVEFPFPVCVQGFYVNNTTYAALSMLNGDWFSKKFGGATGDDPDWFKLTIVGKDRAGHSVGSVEFYLADYRFTNNALDYIVSDWTWVDLSSMGPHVKTLHFTLSSSDTGPWGMNTPAYFALDGLAFSPKPAILMADFENLGLAPGDYWNGSDLRGGFESEWVAFGNSYDTNWHFWSGFACSSVSDTNTPGYGNQYAVWTPGSGMGGTGAYAVGYDSTWDEQDVVTFPAPVLVQGLYVNNTTYAALSMLNGDWFSKKFGGVTGDDPDWFKLTITGKDSSGHSLGSVDFYLADYRFTNNALDYIVSDWTWVELRSLGPRVKTLHFTLSSSDNGPWGMNTPAYFAIDDIQFVYTFSGSMGGTNLYDTPVPGFVGPHGDGKANAPGYPHPSNYVNRAFAGWAAEVVDYSPAPGVAGPWTNAARALGPVTGDNFDIVSLGDLNTNQMAAGTPPGSITLRMGVPIGDQEGPDFAVFENGSGMGGSSLFFGELGYVEVSTDGTNFTRFGSVCLWTNGTEAYLAFDPALYYGLCGKHANAYGESWGTPFDLGDLAWHPDVQSGLLNLTNVNYVRIVDIPGNGRFYDTFTPSNRIYDAWLTWGSGGVDLEAVGVLHSPGYARIKTRAVGPGRIDPYGMPDGVVAVAHGSNVAFAILANSGYHLRDVLVNGVSQGPVTNYTFTNVLADQTLTAVFGSRLVVESPYGSSSPEAGTHYGYGAFEVSLANATITMGTTQYVCLGWTGSGSVPPAGTGTVVQFTLTNESTLAWLWGTNYWLSVESVGEGAVTAPIGWHNAGAVATSTATADPYYEFRGWAGDVEGDTNAASMAVTMHAPRQLVAHFGAELATNGVPVSWLIAHGLTNGTPDEAAMSDRFGKGMKAWEEFYAGTDPNDPHSVFKIVDIGLRNGSNYVVWIGGTNGSRRPFTVLAAPSLRGDWIVLSTNAPRSASGTNLGWISFSPSNAFYRIRVDTGR